MSEINEIFADIKKEGTDPFEQFDKENETPTESQSVKEQDTEEPIQGDDEVETEKPKDNTEEDENSPFHIRWKAREEKLQKDFDEKFEAYKREIGETIEEKIKSDSDIPEWFTELYGDNQFAWEKYEAREKIREEEIEKRIITAYENKQKEQVAESKKWEKWVDDQISVLEKEGKKFDKNELIKTVVDFRPTDEQGNFDLRKGYEILEALKSKQDIAKTQNSLARKQLADTTTKVTKGDAPAKDYMTPADLRNKSWNQL